MPDKITKFLKRLSKNQRLYLDPFIDKLLCNDTKGLDVKPLKGYPGLYRLRAGRYRIIFRPISQNEAKILFVGRRDGQTYRDL